MANVEFVAGDIDICDTSELNRSADNLKVIVTTVDVEQVDALVEPESDTSLESCTSEENQMGADEAPSCTSLLHPNDNNTLSANAISIPANRLKAADSGFGSYGRTELFPSRSIGSVATMPRVSRQTNTTSVYTKPIANHATTTSTSAGKGDQSSPPAVSKSTSSAQREKMKSFQNNRNPTLLDTSAHFELDAKLINRCDGFKEVQCYFDENGSPKVREKNSRRKSTLKQELKARSLGASYDGDALRKIHQNKKPSCISFARFSKKFKEIFLSKCS